MWPQQTTSLSTNASQNKINQWCQVIFQKQARKFERQAKNTQFNRKTSPKCVGRKTQQNEKLARKSNKKSGWQIRKNKPKMSIFSQKHAQHTFRSKFKQQNCHKIWKKAIPKTEICKKQAQKTSKFQLKQAQNKQFASLHKNQQLHKKTSPTSRENRKVGNTEINTVVQCPSEMITIRFAGWISGRIVSLQLDKDIQKMLSNMNRIRIRISEKLLSIFRGFRLLEKVAHCTITHLLSSEASFQPSAPCLWVCLWCNLWTVKLCQVC